MTDPTAVPPLDPEDVLSRLAAARTAFEQLRPRVVAGAPWALAADAGIGPEASWGPPETLAHVAEALQFWKGEFERVVEAARPATDPLPFGRVASDTLRIGVLERDRSLPLGELFERIDAGIARWEARLPAVSAAELTAHGQHAKDGVVPASWIRDRFIVRHLEEHVEQLEGILAGG